MVGGHANPPPAPYCDVKYLPFGAGFKESLDVLSEDLDEGGMTTYLTGILKAVQSNGKEGPWKEVLRHIV